MTARGTHGESLSGLKALLSVREVAQLLLVSQTSVYRLVGNGDLSGVKIGGRTLLEAEAAQEFIAGCRELSRSETNRDPISDAHDEVAEASQHA